jgi:hypothetical protein
VVCVFEILQLALKWPYHGLHSSFLPSVVCGLDNGQYSRRWIYRPVPAEPLSEGSIPPQTARKPVASRLLVEVSDCYATAAMLFWSAASLALRVPPFWPNWVLHFLVQISISIA